MRRRDFGRFSGTPNTYVGRIGHVLCPCAEIARHTHAHARALKMTIIRLTRYFEKTREREKKENYTYLTKQREREQKLRRTARTVRHVTTAYLLRNAQTDSK